MSKFRVYPVTRRYSRARRDLALRNAARRNPKDPDDTPYWVREMLGQMLGEQYYAEFDLSDWKARGRPQ